MVKKNVFLFPGQGSQVPGMAVDLYEKSDAVKTLFKQAGDICSIDFLNLLNNGSAKDLQPTNIAQPALTLANISAAYYLIEQGLKPHICAGHSLGEYAALHIAGILDFDACMQLVLARGKAMQKAGDALKAAAGLEAGQPGMAAVLGLAPTVVESAVENLQRQGLKDIYVANLNSPRQVVLSGTATALDGAEEALKKEGARRVVRLNVAGPFHSPLVQAAADEFAEILNKTDFKQGHTSIFSNVTAKVIRDASEARSLALRQITEPVRWSDEEQAIAKTVESAAARALEVGPGKVLQGLWVDAVKDIPCFGAGTANNIDEILGAIE